MTGCPPDAEEFEWNLELAVSVKDGKHRCNIHPSGMGYVCTRPVGHNGSHHAHSADGGCVWVWDDGGTKPDSPPPPPASEVDWNSARESIRGVFRRLGL